MFGRDDALLDKRYSTASPQAGQHQDTSFGSVGSVAFAPVKPDFLAEDSAQLPSFATPLTPSPAPVAAAPAPQPVPMAQPTAVQQPAPAPQPAVSAAPVETPVFKTITKTQVVDSPAIPDSMNFSALFGSPAKMPQATTSTQASAQPQPLATAAQPANSAELPARQLEALGAVLQDFRSVDAQSFPAEAQLSLVALETLTRQALNGDSAAQKHLHVFGYEHFLTIARTLPAGHATAKHLNQIATRLIGSGLMVPACTHWQASASTL